MKTIVNKSSYIHTYINIFGYFNFFNGNNKGKLLINTLLKNRHLKSYNKNKQKKTKREMRKHSST